MASKGIPASFWRGGTSNALVFDIADLPADRSEWDAIFLSAMGSPDSNGRQLDGMGGGVSSLSKVCVLGPPSCDDADVDFTFAQVSIGKPHVDYGGNCGNMVSAMGPAALDLGIVAHSNGDMARIRIHNTNTGKIIVGQFPVRDGELETDGVLAIDGVAGTAAPIRLDFLDPGGAKTGLLLPTGFPVDRLSTPGGDINATLVDAANPCVFVTAADLGVTGAEHPDELAANAVFMTRMEEIRCAGSVRMGLARDLPAAARMQSIPKVAIVAPPAETTLLSGVRLAASDVSLMVRMLSMEQPHRATPITGAICLGLAVRIPGSIPAGVCTAHQGPITISHPSGSTLVDAEVTMTDGFAQAVSGSVYRSARKLFSGLVYYRA